MSIRNHSYGSSSRNFKWEREKQMYSQGNKLEGKVAIVTGAASGIGEA